MTPLHEHERINKYVAHSTGLSRREADNLVALGKVKINGRPARIGELITPKKDQVTIDHQTITKKQRYSYLLLNKPVGYVCSRKKQGDNPTIYELLPRQYKHLKVAGRLDKDSSGLLLLTDDGDKIFELTHPKFGKNKVYHIGLNKPLIESDAAYINKGLELEDGKSNLSVEKRKSKLPNTYTVRMSEGRNRQIRRTFKHLGYTVTHLERTRLGVYSLDEIKPGQYLQLSQ